MCPYMRHQTTVPYTENDMAEYKVVETFVSINGEGRKAGELAFFLRLKGCNLDCSYCDTNGQIKEMHPLKSWMKMKYTALLKIRNP